MGAFDEVFVTWRGQAVRLVNGRGSNCGRGTGGNHTTKEFYLARTAYLVCAVATPTASVPADGLHFYPVPEGGGTTAAVWQRSLELRLVDGTSQRTIGFWGVPRVSYPAFPPVLTPEGFSSDHRTITSPVLYYGEIPFLFGRLGLKAGKAYPTQPAIARRGARGVPPIARFYPAAGSRRCRLHCDRYRRVHTHCRRHRAPAQPSRCDRWRLRQGD